MINANGEIVVDQTTSCTIDDALFLMLGITIGTVPESVDTCLDDILDAEKDQAEAGYIEAKAEKLSDDLIKTAFDNLTKTDQLLTKAVQYRRDITDELAKKESALRLDESNRITINSLRDWANEVLQISNLGELDIGKSNFTQPSHLAPMEAIEINSTAPARPKKTQRNNALSLELNEILRKNPRAKPAEVMMVLRRLVGEKNSIIIDVLDEGVKWTKDDGNVEITSREALGERIRYWRKHRLSPD